MKSEQNIVITGSSRGIGFALAAEFLKANCHVTLSGKNKLNLDRAAGALQEYGSRLFHCLCDVTVYADVERLWNESRKRWGRIDIWINNAGVPQASVPVWEIAMEKAGHVIGTNITGLVYGSQTAMRGMLEQGHGQIYNLEGFGADGSHMKNLTLYGMTKTAVRYFTRGLSQEARGKGVLIGTLHPGMMPTDFVLANMPQDPHTRRRFVSIMNIIGERPEVVARFLVPRMLKNKRQGAHFQWLTGRKMLWRFLCAPLVKRKIMGV